MNTKTPAALVFCLLGFDGIFAQQASSAGTEAAFEVASIRSSAPGTRFSMAPLPGGKFSATGVTVRILIGAAFDLPSHLVSGVPDWANSDKFDLAAEAGHPANMDEIRLMIQHLLADRFQLKTHEEKKNATTYGLVVAKKFLLKNSASEQSNSGIRSQRGRMIGQRATMQQLSEAIGNTIASPVSDETGVDGFFDFTLTWSTTEGPSPSAKIEASATDSEPSLSAALREQLGLKLEPRKRQIGVLVVDKITRPSPN